MYPIAVMQEFFLHLCATSVTNGDGDASVFVREDFVKSRNIKIKRQHNTNKGLQQR